MATTKQSYKDLSAKLNAIIEWFEGDQVNLDEAVAKYEEANKLIEQMEDYLKTAENKVKKISAQFNQ
jgi:exodeoxyribonuclease VII small subunit